MDARGSTRKLIAIGVYYTKVPLGARMERIRADCDMEYMNKLSMRNRVHHHGEWTKNTHTHTVEHPIKHTHQCVN